MRAQNILQNPLTAQHRRGPVGVRGHQVNAPFSQQSAAHVQIPFQLHAPELGSINVWNPIMHGQTFVDERVVCR